MKLPTIKGLSGLLTNLKPYIDDEYLDVTIGWNAATGDWGYQTGDNSFSGAAYLYPHWGVVSLEKRSNCRDLARDIRSQLEECVVD